MLRARASVSQKRATDFGLWPASSGKEACAASRESCEGVRGSIENLWPAEHSRKTAHVSMLSATLDTAPHVGQ